MNRKPDTFLCKDLPDYISFLSYLHVKWFELVVAARYRVPGLNVNRITVSGLTRFSNTVIAIVLRRIIFL
jgi:hypothetical protein